jgi:hypothetical protein
VFHQHFPLIPGVDRTSAITVISEIGTDMSYFSPQSSSAAGTSIK